MIDQTETQAGPPYPIRVQGYCPMGCGQTLHLTSGGTIACRHSSCPRRYAAAEVLYDEETEHVVELGETTFTVRHPLRERLDDALMTCQLHEYLAQLDGPPAPPGRYRVTGPLGQLHWEALTP